MKRIANLLLTLALAASPGLARAADIDLPMPGDSRIKLLPYDETDVYTIPMRYGYQTNIVFDAREEIQTISVGDRSVWQIIPSGSRLFIKPMVEGAVTNMTLLTNRHSYQFDLVSLPADDKTSEIVYVAKFVYAGERPRRSGPPPMEDAAMLPPPPPPPPAPDMPLPPPPVELAPPPPATGEPMDVPASLTPAAMNYNYTYTGSDTLAPLQVYDNGVSTFIKFRDPSAIPEILPIDAAGNTMVMNGHVRDNMLVIDGTAPVFKLQSGGETVTIYNETLVPQDAR